MLDPEVLAILACPYCRGSLLEHDKKLLCQNCGRIYPIENDIPILLIEKAIVPKNV